MSGLSPMMTQYVETKKQYEDCILFYRLGDFYEMFFEDAKTVSKELELTLTGKECGLEERAPMCGVPYHAVDSYLSRLVQKGYKVAIAEQMEDPKLAKGLVKREVIRVVTPGTITSAQALDETRNNYLMGIVYLGDKMGVAVADITTGDFLVTEVESERSLFDEINKFSPSEIICNDAFSMSGISLEEMKGRYHITVSSLDSRFFQEESCRRLLREHFKVGSLEGLGLADYDCGVTAAGAVLQYLYETQKNSLDHMTTILPYSTGNYMVLDSSTRRNLELLETLREKQKRGSLLWVLDKTRTAMGARLLRSWIEQPLIERKAILVDIDGAVNVWIYLQAVLGIDNRGKNMYYVAKSNGQSEKMYFVPWDMDLTWGDSLKESTGKNPWEVGLFPNLYSERINWPIGDRLVELDVEDTRERIRERWKLLREGPFSDESLVQSIDGLVHEVRDSGALTRDRQRWPDSNSHADYELFKRMTLYRMKILDYYFDGNLEAYMGLGYE